MSHEHRTVNGHNVLHSNSHQVDRPVSTMRRYLESGVDFTWPPEVGKSTNNHCDLKRGTFPLEWRKKISDKQASIDEYIGDERYTFREPFAVKTVREASHVKSDNRARTEVANMRGMRHPHVVALLGTFTYADRLHIAIYPSAPCDLEVFMKRLSEEIELQGDGGHLNKIQIRPGTPDSRSSLPGSLGIEDSFTTSTHHAPEPSLQPCGLPLTAKIEWLQRYFVCLAQALDYMHASGVRHKDIKPENILIDSSGSIVFTDFGISRTFPKSATHITNDRWDMTRKYASPEIMKGKKAPRGDPSDVFSLACVFLEMATLITGRSLADLKSHIFRPSTEEAYHCNLETVYTWIENLKRPVHIETRSSAALKHNQIASGDFALGSSPTMTVALGTICEMLQSEPDHRPLAKGLWEKFQSVSPEICRDCDPRHPQVWEPNDTQRENAAEGLRRRSLHQAVDDQLPEEQSDTLAVPDSSKLSANYKPDMHRRSSSPHANQKLIGKQTVAPNLELSNAQTAATQDTNVNMVPFNSTTPQRWSTPATQRYFHPEGITSTVLQSSLKNSQTFVNLGNIEESSIPLTNTQDTAQGRRQPRSGSPSSNPLGKSEPSNDIGRAQPASISSHVLTPTSSMPIHQDTQSSAAVVGERLVQDSEIPVRHLPLSHRIIIHDLATKDTYVGVYAQIKGD